MKKISDFYQENLPFIIRMDDLFVIPEKIIDDITKTKEFLLAAGIDIKKV